MESSLPQEALRAERPSCLHQIESDGHLMARISKRGSRQQAPHPLPTYTLSSTETVDICQLWLCDGSNSSDLFSFPTL